MEGMKSGKTDKKNKAAALKGNWTMGSTGPNTKASGQPAKHAITIQARTPIYTQQNRLREEVASENFSRT